MQKLECYLFVETFKQLEDEMFYKRHDVTDYTFPIIFYTISNLIFKIIKSERGCSKVWLPCMVGASDPPPWQVSRHARVTYFILHI